MYSVPQTSSQIAIVEKYIPEETNSALTINYDINNNLPKETYNRQYCPPVLNQENQNGCLPFAITSMIQYYQNKNLYSSPLSAEALYYWVREYEGNTNQNVGTHPNNGLDIAQKTGVPEEKYDPNIEQNEFVKPSQQALQSAILSRIDSWKRIDLGGNKSDIIAEQLARGDCVLMCFYMSDQFINPPLDGIVDVDKNVINYRKTHAIMVVDYKTLDDGRRLYLCLNTWGKWYGNNGFVWLTENFIQRNAYYGAIIQFGELQAMINSINNNKDLIG